MGITSAKNSQPHRIYHTHKAQRERETEEVRSGRTAETHTRMPEGGAGGDSYQACTTFTRH